MSTGVVAGSVCRISVTRYAEDWKDINALIRYKASTYGGLDTQQEIEKGPTYLAVLKPQGYLQSVFVFKKAKGGSVETECIGPPAHAARLKEPHR
jgi:hypothetical protein